MQIDRLLPTKLSDRSEGQYTKKIALVIGTYLRRSLPSNITLHAVDTPITMRSRLYFSLVPLMGLARGLYISDDLIRNPFRPLPLPPEIVLQTSLNIEIRQNKDTVLATKPTITLPVAPTTIPLFPPYPAPIPMDLQLSYALTTPCLSYLTTLLSTDTFLSCLPFSLLLTTSTGYAAMLTTAATTGNYTTLNTLMAYVTSPQPSSAECDAFMSAAYAKMGEKSSGCTADLSKRSAAADARVGLGSAGLMRKAAGLRNPGSGKWCYLEALASDRPDDLYLWSLPAGIA